MQSHSDVSNGLTKSPFYHAPYNVSNPDAIVTVLPAITRENGTFLTTENHVYITIE